MLKRVILLIIFFALPAAGLMAADCVFENPGDYEGSAAMYSAAAECASKQLDSLAASNKKLAKAKKKENAIPVFVFGNYEFDTADVLAADHFLPVWSVLRPKMAADFKKRSKNYSASSGQERSAALKNAGKNGRKPVVYIVSAKVNSGKKNNLFRYNIRFNVSAEETGKKLFSVNVITVHANELEAKKNTETAFPQRTEDNIFAHISNPELKMTQLPESTRPVRFSEISDIPTNAPASMETPDVLIHENIQPEEKDAGENEKECRSREECENRKIYEKGLQRYSEGNYDKALRIFNSLGNYRNSVPYRNSSFYNYAGQLYNDGSFEESLRLSSQMGSYAHNKKRMKLMKYSVGLKKLYSNPVDFEGAIYYLSQVEGMRNSSIYLNEARTLKYNRAAQLNNAKKFEEAQKMFLELKKHEDSSSRATETFYNQAKSLYKNKEYDKAFQMFRKLGSYEESRQYVIDILDIHYNEAVKLYNSKKYPEAAAAFENLDGHRDSRIRAYESWYAQAVLLLQSKKYDEAVPFLKKAKNYADSKKLVDEIEGLKSLVPYETGDSLFLGRYKEREIEWKVLYKDYESMLLICSAGLDVKKFDAKSSSWEKSSLRKWLNGDFIKSWNEGDRKKLIPYKYKGSKENDKVFLLNTGDAASLFKNDKERIAEAGEAALKNSAKTGGKPPKDVFYGWWWLQSEGLMKGRAAVVVPDGIIMFSGIDPASFGIMVRPAVWVKAAAFRQKKKQ